MDENMESNGAQTDLLLQSYCQGIQKLIGNDEKIPDDFQLPPHIVEQRKKAWSDLFEKYSSNVSDVELNILTLRPDDEQYENSSPQKRLPMRKPMLVVQHWVNTGNLPYAKNSNCEKSHSDTGSSLDEEFMECDISLNSSCSNVDSNLDKKSKNTENTPLDFQLRLASSSGSSVDTAVYILANNNTTKKADSATAKVKNLKHNKRKFNVVSNYPLTNSLVDTRQVKHTTAGQMNIEKVAGKIFDQAVSPRKNKTAQAKESTDCNVDIAKGDDVDEILTKTASHIHLLGSANSDESIITTLKINNNMQSPLCKMNSSSCDQTTFGVSKFMKRKKLYNYTESPVELTPASEDNCSLKPCKVSLKNGEHPGLETPRVSSRLTYQIRRKKIVRRRKRNSRLLSFMKDSKQNGNYSPISEKYSVLPDSTQLNGNSKITAAKYSFNKQIDEEKIESKTNEVKMKPLIVALQRLPHTYAESKLERNFETCHENQIFDQLKECSKRYKKNISKPDVSFLDNGKFFDSVNKLFFNSTKNKQCFKSFIETQSNLPEKSLTWNVNNDMQMGSTRQKYNLPVATNLTENLNYKSTSSKITQSQEKSIKSVTVMVEKSSDDNEEKENNERFMKKPTRYTIVLSSSDESDDICAKNNRISKFVKSNFNSRKVLSNKISKQSSFKTNLRNQVGVSDSKKVEVLTQERQNDQSPETLPSVDAVTTIPTQFDNLKINENKNHVPNESNGKGETASFKKRRKRKNIILRDDTSDEDDILPSKNLQVNKFKSKVKKTNLKTVNNSDNAIPLNEMKKTDQTVNGFNLETNTKINDIKEKHFNNNLSNNHNFNNEFIKYLETTTTFKENLDSILSHENLDNEQNRDKNKNVHLNGFNENTKFDSKKLSDDVVSKKSKSRSNNAKVKNVKSPSIKEKCRVFISSDEECFVPLKF